MVYPNRLPWSQRIFYGVGHSFNDLVASMWFSYLMIYLQLVLNFDPRCAGLILLIGQVTNAIATPLLGYEVSNIEESNICKRYGKRKFFHLIGTAFVTASFPFIFSVCPGCENASKSAYIVMLIPFVIVFQVGWAAVQVSHLSLIPAITPYGEERDFLNALRYAVDIASDMSTYIIVWCVLDLTRKPTGSHYTVTAEYADKFMLIVIIIVVVGVFVSAMFHIGVRENRGPQLSSEKSSIEWKVSTSFSEESSSCHTTITWQGWLREIHFYQVGFLYMFARLFQTMSCMFMPLYLQEYLRAEDNSIAKIPLVMNMSGFAVSCSLHQLSKRFSKKGIFLAGAVLGVGSCACVALGHGPSYCQLGIYGVGIFMGGASSAMVVIGLSFIPELIGTSTESGAFVYGCMSFWDKLANGVAGMVIQQMHSLTCDKCDWFYKDVLSYGVGGTAILASIVLLTLLHTDLGQRKSPYNGANLFYEEDTIKYQSEEHLEESRPLIDN